MSPEPGGPARGGEEGGAAARHDRPLPEMVEPYQRGALLLRFFLVLLIGLGLLFYLHARGIESELTEALVRTDLEEKAERFSREARRLLEGSELADYFDRNQPGFLRFRQLVETVEARGEGAAYLHVQEGGGRETLLLRGPNLVQKLTVGPEGVEILEGDDSTIRQMIVQRGEEPPEYVPVARPLSEALSDDLEEVAFRSPEERFARRIHAARVRVRRRLYLYAALGFLLVTAVFFLLRDQLGRIRHLRGQVQRQRQLAYVGTLAGGLVHELRNPLNGISLNLHLLEESLGGADERVQAQSGRFLGRIRPALEHLDRIVTEFLDFARPRRREMEPLALDALAEQVIEFLEPQARERGIELSLERRDQAASYSLRGDRERLRQVLMNLARNAFEAMEGGGELHLVLGLTDRDEVELRVRDTGRGIEPGQEETLFRLFYTTREGGTGLGLPIVRRVVEDHGGRIRVEPVEGPGACFVITLPPGPLEG